MTFFVAHWRLLTLALAAGASLAGARAAEKRAYSWSNPTPENLLRELSTDRPDATESPFTVDPGHVQFEFDLLGWTRSRSGGGSTTEWAMLPFNLRAGIRHNFELGIFVTPAVRLVETPGGGPGVTVSGLGDTTLRAKWNFSGNDTGGPGLGLIADLKIPTAKPGLGNGKVEGGMILPLALDLTGGWSLGGMAGLAAVHEGGSYRAVLTSTATIGRDLADNLGAYLEITSEAGMGPHACSFDAGLTFTQGRHRQFDLGLALGVSRAAPDVSVFAGLTQRF